ncbi:MAG: UvrB/UvrC motif-containing protein [Kiritimatiellae bacterium]|nr:UvrB/UvrC motif-containing protein [Kiritimatiellia bacterium]MCO5062399.1 UvrB/UvrC motif-containing protein [Kiritimatiellia bacterium]MCO6400615.1 UvrB/UvrC motif-containing protein [Verrucomicrobiota bacterium]
MSADLDSILGNWAYDPTSISARWVVGRDGRRKVQLRLDLGVLQMEPSGRPDGQRPFGRESLLVHYLQREEDEGLDMDAFTIDAAGCAELQQESAQYYYRYISLYALRDLDGVVEDTDHNLELLELVSRHVEDDELAWQFMQFYPYIRMMNARATAERFSEAHEYDAAITALEAGIADIRNFWSEQGDEEDEEESREIELLTDLLGDLRGSRPRSEADKLQDELSRAIATENYERAAILRDALKVLRRP